jgi:hypothetical protein
VINGIGGVHIMLLANCFVRVGCIAGLIGLMALAGMAQAENAAMRGAAAIGVALNAPAQARPMMRPGRSAPRTTEICPATLTRAIPDRGRTAMPGSAVVASAAALSGAQRDRFLAGNILNGNLPDFLRHLMPVIFLGNDAAGQKILITLCVTPDYLAVGDDRDYVRVPMGLPAAAQVAERFGFMLPTTRIVDAIYAQADLKLAPQPMPAGPQMRSTRYFNRHNATVEGQSRAAGLRIGELIAGQKKDLVLSNVLRSHPGRVAIYGWHRTNGQPIQPLSTVHGEFYADYSHGIRLVSQTAFVDRRPVALADLLADPAYAAILSKEGPIRNAEVLMASLPEH